MNDHKKISGFSIGRNNTVSKNGEKLFETEHSQNAEDFLLAAYQYFNINYPKFYKMDNLCKLGIIATEILLKEQNFENDDPFSTAIVLSNSNSSLDADIRYYDSTANIPSPALFVYTLPNIVIGEISIKYSFKGENAFFIFEKFDAGFITQYVNNLLEISGVKKCICGWVDFLKKDYDAVLFLVEKSTNDKPAFTKENLNNIYQQST